MEQKDLSVIADWRMLEAGLAELFSMESSVRLRDSAADPRASMISPVQLHVLASANINLHRLPDASVWTIVNRVRLQSVQLLLGPDCHNVSVPLSHSFIWQEIPEMEN